MSALRLELRSMSTLPPVERWEDSSVFQTAEWLRFVARTQHAEPVLAAVMDGSDLVGRFTGLLVRRAGMRFLGSPLPGWSTAYMGFNLRPDVRRPAALRALEQFAFRDLRCAHVEIMDRHLTLDEAAGSGLRFTVFSGFEVDLTKPEPELLRGMTSACRRCIRKATDLGVVVEPAWDSAFVGDYYAQLCQVFARQGLAPTYPQARVAALVEALLPTGRLLLLRARDAQGTCIATGIFPAAAGTMYFWGGASVTDRRILRPNEALQWAAMRYWKSQGADRYDMGGAGDYKRKYGGTPIAVPWLRSSRYAVLEPARTAVRTAVRARQTVRHRLHGDGIPR